VPVAEPVESPINADSENWENSDDAPQVGEVVVCSIPKHEFTEAAAEPAEAVCETEAPEYELIIIENITAKAFAVIGRCDMLPGEFRDKFGSENKYIKHDGQKFEGYIFSKKRREMLSEIIHETGMITTSIS